MDTSAKKLVRAGRFLSLVLRHRPETIALALDAEGWARVSDIVDRADPKLGLTETLIAEIVASNDKQRFALSSDGNRIRANQGHSIEVDLGLLPEEPPELLYHGTATRFWDSIAKEGLRPGSRQHVHLSSDEDTAIAVGKRYGKPLVLTVASGEMHRAGHAFFVSANGVWLTPAVPSEFLSCFR